MRVVAEDSSFSFEFNTVDSSGEPATLSGTPSVYARVNGGATEITSGLTLTVDFDSKTGHNKVDVDLSASASYTAGARISVFVLGTNGIQSVNDIKVYEVLTGTTGSLDQAITRTLVALPPAAYDAAGGLPISDAGALDLDLLAANAAATLVDTNEMQGDLANGGRLDLIFDAILEDTGTTLPASLTAIETDTQDLQTQIGAAGAGLTGLPDVTLADGVTHGGTTATLRLGSSSGYALHVTSGNTSGAAALIHNTANGGFPSTDRFSLDCVGPSLSGAGIVGGIDFAQSASTIGSTGRDQINAEVDLALSDYDGPTKAELDAGFAALNDISQAQAQTAADAALVANHLDHLFAVAYDASIKPGAPDALLNEIVEDDSGLTRATANFLELAPAGGILTQQQVRDAMKLAPSAGSPSAESVDAHLDTLVAGGGGGTVVTAVAATVDSGEVRSPRLLAQVSGRKTWALTFVDQSGNAISVDGSTLRLVVEDGDGNDLFDVSTTGSSNTASFAVAASDHSQAGDFEYSVRNEDDDDFVLAHNEYIIQRVPIKD